MMIIYRVKSSNIGYSPIPDSKCGYCAQDGTQVFVIFGNYAHIFWMPLFPTGKEVYAECKHCIRTLEQ